MADYQIFTPPREPREDELINYDPSSGIGIIFYSGKIEIGYATTGGMKKIVLIFDLEPSVKLKFDFEKYTWESFDDEVPVNILDYDLTVPESEIASATYKAPFFYVIAFEKGTTACKLAAVNDAKLLIRDAIINKGVSVPVDTTFRQYADKIKQIKVGGTASVEVDTRPAFNTSVEYVESGVKKTLEVSTSAVFNADIGSTIVVFTDAYLEFDGGLTPLPDGYSCNVNGDGRILANIAA